MLDLFSTGKLGISLTNKINTTFWSKYSHNKRRLEESLEKQDLEKRKQLVEFIELCSPRFVGCVISHHEYESCPAGKEFRKKTGETMKRLLEQTHIEEIKKLLADEEFESFSDLYIIYKNTNGKCAVGKHRIMSYGKIKFEEYMKELITILDKMFLN